MPATSDRQRGPTARGCEHVEIIQPIYFLRIEPIKTRTCRPEEEVKRSPWVWSFRTDFCQVLRRFGRGPVLCWVRLLPTTGEAEARGARGQSAMDAGLVPV